MRARTFLSGVLIGLLAGAGGVFSLLHARLPLLASTLAPPLKHCAADLDTTEWKTFRSSALPFEFRYPPTYEVKEDGKRVTITSLVPEEDGIRTSLTLESFSSTFGREMTPEMRLASWKVEDRQTFALTTSYFTDENTGSLSEIYLFGRDFPAQGWDETRTIVRATVVMSPRQRDILAAKQAKLTDLESILTEPEQILSTFRFFQRTELPGRDGRRIP